MISGCFKRGFAITLAGCFALALSQGAGAQPRTTQTTATTTRTMERGVTIGTTIATRPTTATTTAQGTVPSAMAKPVNLVKPSNEGLRFNFRGVPLDTVLEYLSKSAGLIIVRPAGQSVQGRVDVESATPVTREEAVNLLNNVLKKNGFGAILNERTLEIFPINQVYNPNIPVETERQAIKIKKTDEMVTMIIPVRYTTANALMQNLEALLPQYAIISTNDASNAVVLTATRADARHVVEIIEALDTSISDISTLKVFMLQHADATEMAKLIADLFKPVTSTGGGSSPFGGGRGGMPFGGGRGAMAMMFGSGRGGSRGGGSADSAARQAAQQVTAVADARTNALVVSAPTDTMPTIEELIAQIDTSTAQLCEIRVFALKYADATQMATLINNVYQPLQQQSGTGSSSFGGGGFTRRFMGGSSSRGGFGGGSSSAATPGSKRSQESIVLAVPDIRTNSVIVNADKDVMEQIAPMVQSLDNDPSREKKVTVVPLKYADAEKTASMLQNMLGDTSRSNRNTNRSNLGVFSSTNTNSNRNSTRSSSSSNSSSGNRAPSGMSGLFN